MKRESFPLNFPRSIDDEEMSGRNFYYLITDDQKRKERNFWKKK
jgi:hypothetical protein